LGGGGGGESKPDPHDGGIKLFADKFGFSDRLFKNIALDGDEPNIEDPDPRIQPRMWTIGYTRVNPETHENAHAPTSTL